MENHFRDLRNKHLDETDKRINWLLDQMERDSKRFILGAKIIGVASLLWTAALIIGWMG
jgi:hypothetical protein